MCLFYSPPGWECSLKRVISPISPVSLCRDPTQPTLSAFSNSRASQPVSYLLRNWRASQQGLGACVCPREPSVLRLTTASSTYSGLANTRACIVPFLHFFSVCNSRTALTFSIHGLGVSPDTFPWANQEPIVHCASVHVHLSLFSTLVLILNNPITIIKKHG